MNLRAGLKACTTTFVVALLSASTAAASSLFDPIYRFRVLPTEHFLIYFHQGETEIATRLGAIAEETWRALQRPFGARPPALTHVVVVDQTELANGYATPLPRDTIVITAVWPAGSEFIGNTDDWLRLVFTHEFTHIVHLDRSEGWARAVRAIFGRAQLAFPNLFLPIWHIEGLATYEESAITGEGRLHAGDFRAIVAEDARAGRIEPLDRVNGGLTDWPAGLAAYAYGLGFHEYLADRYGADKFGQLADATARRVPYTTSLAFKNIYGRSLGDLWRDYQRALSANPSRPDAQDAARRLTHDGFVVSGPRFLAPDSPGGDADIIYAVRTPRAFPTLNRIGADGSRPQAIATRYFGSTAAPDGRMVYFDQQEFRRSVGLYSDLYALDRADGHVRRITTDARLTDPDFSPSTRTMVAVRTAPGRRELVRFTLDPARQTIGEITTVASGPETQFNTPRFSSDGRTIVAERHRQGHQSEIVVIDASSGALRVLAAGASTRWTTPTWGAEDRTVIAAAADGDGPFNLYEIATDDGRRRPITHTTGGATWPVLSPDRKTIVYVGYTTDGFDLFWTPYNGWEPSAVDIRTATERTDANAEDGHVAPAQAPSGTTTRPYSPWRTLAPTSWTPIVEADRNQLRVGAAISGADVLGYHAYAASATWRASSPALAPETSALEPDWELAYAYARWQPTLFVSASSSTTFFSGAPTDAGVPSTDTRREREIEAGVLFPLAHARVSQTAFGSLVRAVDEFTDPDGAFSLNRTGVRAAWSIQSAHSFGYSISLERGLALGVTAELVRRSLGASADAEAATADARMYLPGFGGNHVVAIRASAGAATGDRDLRRVFLLGGGAANPALIDFGAEAISLLRGFPVDTFAGNRVALVNADYRWPLTRIQRGVGTYPIFLHTIHAAVFADAGHAWTRTFDIRDVKTDIGAELSFDLVAGYSLPFTVAFGAAWGHDGSHIVRDGATAFVRIGRAF